MMSLRLFMLMLLLFGFGHRCALSQGTPGLDAQAYEARRQRVMNALRDGLVLLQARTDAKHYTETGLHQDLDFYYLTGLEHVLGAILVLDGPADSSWLFLPTRLTGLATRLATQIPPGTASEARTSIDRVVDWGGFDAFVERRLAAEPGLVFYALAEAEDGSSTPPGYAPVGNAATGWRFALETRWPGVEVRTARAVLQAMRAIKDEAEVAALLRAGRASGTAMLAGIRVLAPGKAQRAAEAAVVAACLANGADGLAFWPWMMSGPNGLFPMPFKSFGDYRHLNRTMQAGELVRVDVGCEADHYQGDVGRTAPVSGRFSPGQREAWHLLIEAYRAGLAAMRDGTAWSMVAAASRSAVQRAEPGVLTSLGREAAKVLLSEDGVNWHHHGIGLYASEPAPDTLRAGMVIDFEPMFSVGGEGYYLEDMILITPTGHEILTPDLPYTAEEIEALMIAR